VSAAPTEPVGYTAGQKLRLRLFVAGDEPNSREARRNLELLCQDHLDGQTEVEIIDVLQDFRAAVAERVIVTPALIAGTPPTRVVVLGNLSDTARVLAALGVTRRPA
jgi:circadian clock protein KaiB